MKATIDILLRFPANPQTRFWLSVVILIILGLGYLGFKLTKGFIGGYLKADIAHNLKITLLMIHGFLSLILALILPNNYLNDIDFIGNLYKQNELWIAFTVMILLFTFLLLFGSFFTLLTKKKIKDVSK